MEIQEFANSGMKDFLAQMLLDTNRRGVVPLVAWLAESDYFTAPASTKYHLCVSGGLAQHSYNVTKCLADNVNRHKLDIAADSIAICGLLHDVCKVNFYKQTPSGYVVADQLPLGHGEKSVILISRFLELSPAEALAIRWHMGPWDCQDTRTLNQAMATPLVKALMLADQEASYFVDDSKEQLTRNILSQRVNG